MFHDFLDENIKLQREIESLKLSHLENLTTTINLSEQSKQSNATIIENENQSLKLQITNIITENKLLKDEIIENNKTIERLKNIEKELKVSFYY